MRAESNEKKITFSGHGSFPCKILWLKKGYDYVKAEKDFKAPEAVIDLGVGKNMVAAIRYWYKAFGLNKDAGTGWIADYIFDSETGKDPYMEDLGTLWLLHFEMYPDALAYSDVAGLRQLQFTQRFDAKQVLDNYYE